MSQTIRVCVVSDASRVDWALFSWMRPLAEQGIKFTVLACKLPKLPWLETAQVTAVSGETVQQLASAPQLNGRSWDIFYFTSVTAAAAFTKQRPINGRLIIQASSWDLTVAPHLTDGKRFQQEMSVLLSLANRVVVATDALRRTAVIFGANPQKIVVIPPGVNLDYYKPPAQTVSISASQPLQLLSVMPLEWPAGVAYLLHTIRCCLDAGLSIAAEIIGYGSERQRLYYLLDEFQLFDVVQPINHLPRPVLRDKYRQAHFLLQTNLTDAINQQTLDAMASGLPLLAFAGPNWEELLADLSEPLLAPLRQPQKIAHILHHFVQNPTAYGRLRQQVQQLVVAQFGLDRQLGQLAALFPAVGSEPLSVIGNRLSVNRDRLSMKSGVGAVLGKRPLQTDPHLPNLAVATVAVGKMYARWALAMIESMRRNGRFRGPIYVVTDCDDLFAAEENVQVLPVPQTHNPLVAKQYKTRLPEWVPFEQTLFLDADVVVGRPLLDWITAVAPETANDALLMFPDEGFLGEQFHTGIILMQRILAASPLKRWRAALQSGDYGRDQAAFMAVVQPEEVRLMANEYLLFPTIETFKRGYTTTFNHITFTGRQRNFSPEIIHRYLQESLHLATLPMNE